MTGDVAGRVLDIIAREAQRERNELSLNDKIGDLDIESLDMVQIMFGIEEEFDIYVPQENDAFGQQTLQDIVDGVSHLIAETAADPARPS